MVENVFWIDPEELWRWWLYGEAKHIPKNKWRLETENATFALRKIGCKAAENKLILTVDAAIGGLKRVDTLDDGGKDINEETVQKLLCVGAAVQKYSPENVDYVIEHIRKLVTEAELYPYIVRRCGVNCVSGYPHLESSFEEFKSRYESDCIRNQPPR